MRTVRNARLALGVLSLGAMLLLGGCSNMMTSVTDREAKLNDSLPKFHQSVYWGRWNEAAEYVDPLARREFIERHQASRKVENLVELQVENVNYGPDSNTATVDVSVKYFKNPTYMVETRKEEETWKFTTGAGWQYLGAEDLGPAELDQGSTSFRGSM